MSLHGFTKTSSEGENLVEIVARASNNVPSALLLGVVAISVVIVKYMERQGWRK